jgi:hypothetical protein
MPCPHCGNSLQPGQLRCFQCGALFPLIAPSPPPPNPGHTPARVPSPIGVSLLRAIALVLLALILAAILCSRAMGRRGGADGLRQPEYTGEGRLHTIGIGL